MNPLTMVLRLPLLPFEGVIKLGEEIEQEVVRLAEVIEEEAQRKLHDPARIRRELEEAERRWEAGEITDEQLTQVQDELTQLMVETPASPSVVKGQVEK